MSTLYFSASTDNSWDNLSNWWQDSAFSVPASAIPADGDTVYLEGNVNVGPSAPITLSNLYIAQMNNVELWNGGSGIILTGDLIVGKSTYLSGYVNINLTIGGNAYFYGDSDSFGVLTVGRASFSNYSRAFGTITGNAAFNDNSLNESQIEGNGTFNDLSYNIGVVGGNGTFNDLSYNEGMIEGNVTFNDQSSNSGLVSGNASVNYPVQRPIGGTVTGSVTYSGYPPDLYFNAAADGTWDNPANWWKDISFSVPAGRTPITGSTIFIEANLTTGPSYPITLAALSVAQVNSGSTLASSGAGITITGDVTVGAGSSIYGRIDGSYLTIEGTANFYGSSGGNSSTLNVTSANFYSGSSNYGTSQGSSSNGIVVGNASFNNNSGNLSTIEGNATFSDSAYNTGLVSGDATVNYPVSRPLGGTVTGTITYLGYPQALYFNAASDHSWNNLSNWWRDSAFTIPASAIPANGDTVYLEADLTTGPTAAVTLAALYVAQINNGATLGSSGAGISITGDLTVGLGIYLYGRINSSTITVGGTASFYGGSGGSSGSLTVSLAKFYLGTSNYGTAQGSSSNGVIIGNTILYNNAKNYSSITGSATFNDQSSNNSGGNVGGAAIFNDSSLNASGATVGGNATFKNNSSNLGQVTGDASVYYPVSRPIGGMVTGTVTYINYP